MENAQTRVHVLIGPPGAGKTTWVAKYQAVLGEVFSLDEARSLLGHGQADQRATPRAAKWVHEHAEQALLRGESVTIDATAAKSRDRATWISMAQRQGATPVAIVFTTAQAECLRRNRSRRRVVPDPVVTRLWKVIAELTPDVLKQEGFSRVVVLEGDS